MAKYDETQPNEFFIRKYFLIWIFHRDAFEWLVKFYPTPSLLFVAELVTDIEDQYKKGRSIDETKPQGV